jgi:glycosyltransferase involved in cell wall biosynthesis
MNPASLPKFSIIIPAKNEEKFLPGCLDSIGVISYPRNLVEVIVVDNGSTDATREIARSRGAQVLVDRQKNVSGLRNAGARHAKGEILAFIDADCLASSNWLEVAALYFSRPDVVAWGAPPRPPRPSTWVQQTWYLVRQKNESVQDVEWLESMNLFVRKEQFLAAGGFDETLVTCEDVDLSYRLSKSGRIVSDSRISVIHLGEARTVREFMRKEIWRGRSNLSGLKSHGFSLKELPSLSIPLYFGLFLPFMLILVLFSRSAGGAALFLLLSLIPGWAVLFKVRPGGKTRLAGVRLFLLANVYFVARTLALIKR